MFFTSNPFSHFSSSNHVSDAPDAYSERTNADEFSKEAVSMERPFAYIATSAPQLSTERQAQEKDQRNHFFAESPLFSRSPGLHQPTVESNNEDSALAAIFGLMFLLAFDGAKVILVHLFVFVITLMTYADEDVGAKYLNGHNNQ